MNREALTLAKKIKSQSDRYGSFQEAPDDVLTEQLNDAAELAELVVAATKTKAERAIDLVEHIARMTIEGEVDENGNVYEPEGNDDEVTALYRLIEEARNCK